MIRTSLPTGANGTKTEWTSASVAGNKPTFVTIAGARGSDNGYGATYGWADNGDDGLRSYSYEGTAKVCTTVNAISSTVCPIAGTNWAYSKKTPSSPDDNKAYEDSATGERSGRRGNLYNYTAATLGAASATNNTNAMASICPKGWQLPTNAGDHSFSNLLTAAYGLTANGAAPVATVSTRFWAFPLDFLPTGHYVRSYGYTFVRQSDGSWWSGTLSDSDGVRAYALYGYRSFIMASFDAEQGYGFAVRCVAR